MNVKKTTFSPNTLNLYRERTFFVVSCKRHGDGRMERGGGWASLSGSCPEYVYVKRTGNLCDNAPAVNNINDDDGGGGVLKSIWGHVIEGKTRRRQSFEPSPVSTRRRRDVCALEPTVNTVYLINYGRNKNSATRKYTASVIHVCRFQLGFS